jgi:hypothetical protein
VFSRRLSCCSPRIQHTSERIDSLDWLTMALLFQTPILIQHLFPFPGLPLQASSYCHSSSSEHCPPIVQSSCSNPSSPITPSTPSNRPLPTPWVEPADPPAPLPVVRTAAAVRSDVRPPEAGVPKLCGKLPPGALYLERAPSASQGAFTAK